MAIPKEEETYTYEDYIHWPEDERWELISGIPYDMSSAPSRIHQYILFDLSRQIGTFLQDKPCQAYPVPFDVRIPNEKGEIINVYQQESGFPHCCVTTMGKTSLSCWFMMGRTT